MGEESLSKRERLAFGTFCNKISHQTPTVVVPRRLFTRRRRLSRPLGLFSLFRYVELPAESFTSPSAAPELRHPGAGGAVIQGFLRQCTSACRDGPWGSRTWHPHVAFTKELRALRKGTPPFVMMNWCMSNSGMLFSPQSKPSFYEDRLFLFAVSLGFPARKFAVPSTSHLFFPCTVLLT